jgi:hypothetical protein
LGYPQGLAFDRAGNLFVAVLGGVVKFTPTGVQTGFASGLTTPFALAFDSGGNLFVADGGDPWDYPPVPGAVYKFTPTGLRSTIVSDMGGGLAIDSTDNLFVGESHWEQRTLVGSILKITSSGVRTTFASRIVAAMAFQRTLTDFNPPNPATTLEVTVSVSATRIHRGANATFTISASTMNPSQVTTVLYAMSGTARPGIDYGLSGVFGEVDIPAGASSTTVTLHARMRAKSGEKATLTVMPGENYTLSSPTKATVTIVR